MEFFLLLLKFYSVVVLFLIIYDIKWGMTAYLSYFFLVPDVTIGMLPVSLLSIVLFGVTIYKYGFSKMQKLFYIVSPFFLFLLLMTISFPFTDTPLSFQFKMLRVDLINGLLPMFALPLIIFYENSARFFISFFVIIALVTGLYALALTQMNGINPYVFGIKLMSGIDINEGWFADENRLFGRISSTFIHPMTWAFVCGALFVFIFYVRKELNLIISCFLLALLLLDMLFCGVRSVLGAFFVAFVVFIVLHRQFKVLIYSGIFVALLLIILSMNDFLMTYISSIFDLSGNVNIDNGSNISMRLEQLEAAFQEMSRNPLFGNGYCWHSYYLLHNGDHPQLLAFESLVFTVLCDSGLWGIFIWLGYIIALLLLPNFFLKKDDAILIQCFVIYYIAYSFVTGDFSGYFFLWIYAIMFGIGYRKTFELKYHSATKAIIVCRN